MVFWSRIWSTTIEPFSYQCKSWCFQFTGVASIPYVAGGTRIRVSEKKPDFFINHSFSVRFFAAPVQAKPKPEPKDSQGVRINNAITSEFIRLVTDDGHGVVSRREALDRAKRLKLDLVEVQRTAKPPVCKLMDFHKEKYKQQLKEKERVKSKPDAAPRKGICKEVRFTGKIDQKDLQMKAEMVKRLMESGYRVKCKAMGKEGEDLGGLLSRFSELIEDFSVVESGPKVEKSQAFVIVKHSKFGSQKKSPRKKAAGVVEDTGSVQKGATSTPTVDSASPVQRPVQTEEQEPIESGSESEDEILSDEEVRAMNPSDTLTTTPIEIPNEDFSEKKLWSTFDAGDDFEKVFKLSSIEDGITSTIIDGFMDNVDVLSPSEKVDRTELFHQKFPVASVVNGSDLKQSQIFGSSRNAKEPLDPPKPVLGSVREKAGFGNEQTTRVSMPNNISPPGLRQRFPNQKLPVASVNGSDLKQSHIFGSSTSAKEQHAPPKPVLGSMRAETGFGNEQRTRVSMPDNISLPASRNRFPNQVRQPIIHDARKHGHLEAKQEQPTPVTPSSPAPSYGIFSLPNTVSSDDRRRTSLDVNRDNERRSPNSTNSPKLSGMNPNTDPPKSKGESQRQDTDKTEQSKWGIFSR